MSKQSVFKKVMVSDRLPKESDIVDTNLGELKFYKGTRDFTIVNKTKIDGSDDRFPKWWLEEIELPIEDEIQSTSTGWKEETKQECYIEGAEYILNKLK